LEPSRLIVRRSEPIDAENTENHRIRNRTDGLTVRWSRLPGTGGWRFFDAARAPLEVSPVEAR